MLKSSYLRIRNFLGLLGCLLPVLCVAGAAFSPNTVNKGWWYSISVTYYSSPMLTGVLAAVGLFLIVYRSYETVDTVINTIAGFFALCVVCFPCECSWLPETTRVGLFWLPIYITKWVHYATAFLLFLLLAINSIWLFAKGKNPVKNMIYKICGWTMIGALLCFGLNMVWWKVEPMIIFWETVMLLAFGFSWLVKGHCFDKWFGRLNKIRKQVVKNIEIQDEKESENSSENQSENSSENPEEI